MTDPGFIAAASAALHAERLAGLSVIERLCAAIDAGDDALLPVLADALEEAGRLAEAAGLRRLRYGAGLCNEPSPERQPYCSHPGLADWRWFPRRRGGRAHGWDAKAHIPGKVFDKLPPPELRGRRPEGRYADSCYHSSSTRSAAFLALAAALEERP